MPLYEQPDHGMLRLMGLARPIKPAKPDTKLHRVTIHVPDRELETTRVRGAGYRQTSPCGAFTARGSNVRAVRDAIAEHRKTCPTCGRLP